MILFFVFPMNPIYPYNTPELKERRRSLRNHMTPAELELWKHLKSRNLCGLMFRRQFGIGPYIVDFYCPELRLAIELDGNSHFGKEAEAYDRVRQTYIEAFGVHFLRFLNNEVYEDLELALGTIKKEAERLKGNGKLA